MRGQIELVRDAEAIAVDGGAGAANLLFAPSRAKIIILAPLVAYTEVFTPLCALGDLGAPRRTVGCSRPSEVPLDVERF